MTSILGGATFLESASDNQDWVGSGGDPDTIDTDLFTSPDEFVHLWTQSDGSGWKTNINKASFPGDFQTATPLGENDEMITVTGFVKTLAEVNGIKKFAALHNNITDEKIYFVMRHGASSYEQFADSARAMQDYAKGYISDFKKDFDAEERKYNITIIFMIVWD